MKRKTDANPAPAPEPQTSSAEVYDLLEAFSARYTPTDDISEATRNYTTKEIVAALKEFNTDLHIKENDVVEYLKMRGFHYQVLPGNFALKFHWLFVEK